MARCAVPVAERSVRRRKRGAKTRVLARVPPSASLRAGTAQRAVPTIQEPCQDAPVSPSPRRRSLRSRWGVSGPGRGVPIIRFVERCFVLPSMDHGKKIRYPCQSPGWRNGFAVFQRRRRDIFVVMPPPSNLSAVGAALSVRIGRTYGASREVARRKTTAVVSGTGLGRMVIFSASLINMNYAEC
jgi:hypothetical protein